MIMHRYRWSSFALLSRVPTESGKVGKNLVIFQPGKVWKFFWSVQSFDMHFHILFRIDTFTFNVVTAIVLVFDLGMPFVKV